MRNLSEIKISCSLPTTPQQRANILIAKCCGWEESIVSNYPEQMLPSTGYPLQRCPNYWEDQNAIHEAQRVLFGDEILWAKYRSELYRFYLLNDTFPPSAAQRCEAFLQALGLWDQVILV